MAGAPPPYGGPKKKSNTTTIVFVVLGICAACCILGVVGIAAAGYFGFNKFKNTIACTIGFQEAGYAMKDYVDDHDGKLPPADTWQDAIRPYYAKRLEKDKDDNKVFGSFDAEGQWVCKDDSGVGTTGIAFNKDLGGQSLAKIKNKSTTIVLFEVPKTGSNLTMPYEEQPESSSPRVLNSPRGWIRVDADLMVVPMHGKNHINISGSSD